MSIHQWRAVDPPRSSTSPAIKKTNSASNGDGTGTSGAQRRTAAAGVMMRISLFRDPSRDESMLSIGSYVWIHKVRKSQVRRVHGSECCASLRPLPRETRLAEYHGYVTHSDDGGNG